MGAPPRERRAGGNARRATVTDSTDLMRDKIEVRERQYADPGKLSARVDLHARYSTNPQPVQDWEFGLVDLTGVRRALDAGCGTGNFLVPLARRLAAQGGSVEALDLAEGTLGEARARVAAEGLPVTCRIGDVEALPFEDAAFDLVLANYMLYHVPNLEGAIAELRRVLRPGGTLLAATNGAAHMADLWDLADYACQDAGVPEALRADLRTHARSYSRLSFSLENGADWLGRYFSEVRLERRPGDLRVTEAESIVAYLASMWALDAVVSAAAPPEGAAALRSRILAGFRAHIADRIAADGAVRIRIDTGAFIAR
jgi:ubiquinone/menaquinone biosynthesis C-methylase UbiE